MEENNNVSNEAGSQANSNVRNDTFKPEFLNFDKFENNVEATAMIFKNQKNGNPNGSIFMFTKDGLEKTGVDGNGNDTFRKIKHKIVVPFDKVADFQKYVNAQCEAFKKYMAEHKSTFDAIRLNDNHN